MEFQDFDFPYYAKINLVLSTTVSVILSHFQHPIIITTIIIFIFIIIINHHHQSSLQITWALAKCLGVPEKHILI